MTGLWVNTGRGRRHHLGQRPLRPQVQGPGDGARRDARHRAAGDEGRRRRHGRRRPRRTGWRRSTRSARPSTRARSARFTGNEYTEDLTSGNAVASIGWSGDGYLIGRDDVEWRRPDEGCNLWFDMMAIPAGAPNTAAALEFMNFAYEPEVQADIAAFVNYVTPVDGRQGDPRRSAIRRWPRTRSSSPTRSSSRTATRSRSRRATTRTSRRSRRPGTTRSPADDRDRRRGGQRRMRSARR